MSNIISDEYNEPLSPVVTVRSPDSSRLLMHDDFSTPEQGTLKNTKLTISNGIQKTGQLTLTFKDPFGYFTSGTIHKGCRIQVKAKKAHQNTYRNLFSGIITSDNIEESTRRRSMFTINALSMRHIFTHTAVNYEKNIAFQTMKEDTLNLKNDDPNFYIGNMIYEAMTDKNILINDNGLTLQQRGKFTLKGIDRKIPLTIPSLNFSGYADELFNQFQELGGLLFGVDEDNDVYARFPIYKSMGHIVKLDDERAMSDGTDYIMIARDPVSRGSSIEPSNYAEVVIGKAFDSSVLVNNSATNSHLSLFNKDIAQQIDMRSTTLQNLTLILSKTGAGTNSADPENTQVVGYIATDGGGKVGRDVVAEFSIPLRFIGTSAKAINRINVKLRGEGQINVTQKYWLVLQSIGDGEDNTVYWWSDGGKAADQGTRTLAAVRDLPYGRGSSKAFVPIGWRTIRDGPVFSHTFTTTSPILHISRSTITRSDYIDPAPIESIQSPPGILDSPTMEQYLGLLNEQSSRIQITYEFPKVTIPDIPIRPGYSLLYYDISNREHSVNITDVTYDFTAGTESPLGTQFYKLSGVGYDLSREHQDINDIKNQFYCVKKQ